MARAVAVLGCVWLALRWERARWEVRRRHHDLVQADMVAAIRANERIRVGWSEKAQPVPQLRHCSHPAHLR